MPRLHFSNFNATWMPEFILCIILSTFVVVFSTLLRRTLRWTIDGMIRMVRHESYHIDIDTYFKVALFRILINVSNRDKYTYLYHYVVSEQSTNY